MKFRLLWKLRLARVVARPRQVRANFAASAEHHWSCCTRGWAPESPPCVSVAGASLPGGRFQILAAFWPVATARHLDRISSGTWHLQSAGLQATAPGFFRDMPCTSRVTWAKTRLSTCRSCKKKHWISKLIGFKPAPCGTSTAAN